MESPNSWSLFEGSLAVCDLDNPAFVWAFLVVQGLVRDLPGDREAFFRVVTEERENEITGPSVYRRIGLALQDEGILLSTSEMPDPKAELAQQRRQQIDGWLKAVPVKFTTGHGLFCVYCGYNVGDTPNGMPCPNCESPIPEPSATRGKPCLRCEEPNLLFASYCEYCGGRLVVVHCYQCGSEVQPQSLFCPSCGLKIASPGEEPDSTSSSEVSQKETGNHSMPLAKQTDDEQGTMKLAEKVTELVNKPASEPTTKKLFESRIFNIYRKSTDPKQLAEQNADLVAILTSAIQDIVVIKKMMEEKALWDKALYKTLRTQTMIDDHGGPGAESWADYSIYPYTLEEIEFLRHQFDASDEEIEQFEEEIEDREAMS